MTDRLMDAMAQTQPKLCSYLHLPVQSGSSAVLRSMRRGYDREGYLQKIEALRSRVPNMLFGTDIIVGFPTETEADFEDTMTLLDAVNYDTVYSFTYSQRPGTAALDHGDTISQTVKVARLKRLQDHQQSIQTRRHREWIGRQVSVLVEGPSKRDPERWTGRTVDNRIVHFSADTTPGRLETVEIVDSTAYSLRGRPVANLA
jgi:tRNA-2-methylthio-N6-dimethylallyladenosine synthase